VLRIILKLLVILIAAGAGRFAYKKAVTLPMFELKEIKLNTNDYVDPDSIIHLSGLVKGRSTHEQNIVRAADLIARRNGVVSCVIDRGIFSNIDVDIKFAKPELLISGDRIYGLSREGIVLPVENREADFPVVSGRKFKSARCYRRLQDPEIAYALDLYNILKSYSPGLCDSMSEISFESKNLITVYFSPEGTAAVLDKCFTEEDICRLCALHASGLLKGGRIFDLRFGDVIVESAMTKGTL
jgi:hypothetical protein